MMGVCRCFPAHIKYNVFHIIRAMFYCKETWQPPVYANVQMPLFLSQSALQPHSSTETSVLNDTDLIQARSEL